MELVTGKGPDGKAAVFRLQNAVKNGPVIVAFFPGTFTSTCASEMSCFTRDWNAYSALGAQFIGVSVDSAPSQRAWKEKHGYSLLFGSDFEKVATKAWGILERHWWGTVSKRATFIVDRQGIVRFAEVLEDADLEPTYENLRSALKSIK